MKIDNMREEHQEKLIKDAEKLAAAQKEKEKAKEPRKKVGFIAVSIGEGLNEIFKELGVDYIIEGGQTMNPSTEDMLTAIDHVNADYIYILPNNKNIVMAANQARDLTEDKDIIEFRQRPFRRESQQFWITMQKKMWIQMKRRCWKRSNV